jgi:hypothetical protein
MGSLKYADSVKASNQGDGQQLTDAAARTIEALLENQKAPVLALASLVYLHPNWPLLNNSFEEFIYEYSEKYPFFAAQVLPRGLLLGMEFGTITPRCKLPEDVQQDIKLGYGLGQDMLDPKRKDYAINVGSISPDERIMLLPPFYEEGELADGAYTLRYPIFLEDDGSWQMPESPGFDALPAAVKTSGNATFWGWTASIFSWTLVRAGLHQIEERGWLFCLEADKRQFNRSLLAHSYRNGQKAYPPKVKEGEGVRGSRKAASQNLKRL